ncbi:MAG: SDR family NAD(P)-dependent oxidoreductase [Clostridia bacterium]|nr:SDR family NAD(P)-dependent oxidoreductase [Clostridia bacterium]
MRIAIITGASSGLGVEFYRGLQGEALDEIWIIARREDRLNDIKEKYGKIPTRCIPMDITSRDSMERLGHMLREGENEVIFLINNAGMGVLGRLDEANYIAQGNMVDLNARSVTELTTITLPYMPKRSYIINACSIASFVPNARMSVYSATKAYIMSFSRSLRYELKKRKINVTAVCPGPMDTEFLGVAGIEKGASPTFDKLPRCNPEKTAIGAIKASKRGKAVYTPRLFYKFYRVLAKILPTSWLLGAAKT